MVLVAVTYTAESYTGIELHTHTSVPTIQLDLERWCECVCRNVQHTLEQC